MSTTLKGIELQVADSDNRDSTTTYLQLAQVGVTGSMYIVQVDPIELFQNMMENLPDDATRQDIIDQLQEVLHGL